MVIFKLGNVENGEIFINFAKNGENGKNGDDQIKTFLQICDYLRSSFTEIALSKNSFLNSSSNNVIRIQIFSVNMHNHLIG